MGGFFSTSQPPVQILVSGLDAAGKTTMIHKLQMKNIRDIIPVVGLFVERAQYKHLEISSWDSGGRAKMDRPKKLYHHDTAGVIYVIDMTDKDRFDEAVAELVKEISYVEHNLKPDQQAVPLLVFANKMDIYGAMYKEELMANYYFKKAAENRVWHVQECCAMSGNGLREGIDWFLKQLEMRKNSRTVTAECDNEAK